MLILPLAALYVAFLLWHGGRGKPMSRDEIERLLTVAITPPSCHTCSATETCWCSRRMPGGSSSFELLRR